MKCSAVLSQEAKLFGNFLDKVAAYTEALETSNEADKQLAAARENYAHIKDASFGQTFLDQIGDSLYGGFVDHLTATKKEQTTPIDANEGALGNLERKMLLQELIATDPVLKNVAVSKILRAYEQILRLAPQVARERELVRALLRQMTQSPAVEPFVGGQLTTLDIDMMKRRLLREGKMKA